MIDKSLEYAANLGKEDGKSVASWYSIGDEINAARILKGIEDGDPETMDALPQPDLSGEWSGNLSGTQLVEQSMYAAGVRDSCGVRHDLACCTRRDEWFVPICEAYETAFSQAVQDEVQRRATYIVGELSKMDVPRQRMTDLPWLRRNLPTKNANHPNFKRAWELINA